MPNHRTLFTINERGRITAAIWDRFVACIKADGRTIAGALADFIEQTIRAHGETQPSDAPARETRPRDQGATTDRPT